MKRNFLSIAFLTFMVTLFVSQVSCDSQSVKDNTLTKKEISEGWQLLFDGKSFDGWRLCNGTNVPPGWVIKDGAMKCLPRREQPPRADGERGGTGGDILYGLKKFRNFEFSVDWNVGKGGNSGVFYSVVEYPGRPIYYAGVEVQILDNWNAGDNKLANHLAGSLYDILPALPSNAKPSGEWNTLVIRIKDGKVTHTQNGVVVCEYTLWTPQWYELVSKSKFATWETFQEPNPAKEGYIGFQDHGDFGCMFKNIKIREL